MRFTLEGEIIPGNVGPYMRAITMVVHDDPGGPVSITPCSEDGVLRFGGVVADVEVRFKPKAAPVMVERRGPGRPRKVVIDDPMKPKG